MKDPFFGKLRNHAARLPLVIERAVARGSLWWYGLLLLLAGMVALHCLPAVSGDWYHSGNDMQYILPPLRTAVPTDVARWFRGPWIGVELFAYYRPITSLLWYLQFQTFHEQVRDWQIVSLALHTLSTVFLALFLERLFGNRISALVGAYIWGTRANIVNTLEWTPAQTDHFAGFFGIASLLLFQTALNSWQRLPQRIFCLVLSAFLVLLAMGSKEIAYTIPVLAALLTVRAVNLPKRERFFLIAGIFALLVAFVSVRLLVMHGTGFLPGTASAGRSNATRLTVGKWLTQMGRFLLPLPVGPNAVFPFPAVLTSAVTLFLLVRLEHWKGKAAAGLAGFVGTVLLLGGPEYFLMPDTCQNLLNALISLFLPLFTVRQHPREAVFVFCWGVIAYLPLYHVVYNAAGNVTYLPGIYWALGWAVLLCSIFDFLGTLPQEKV